MQNTRGWLAPLHAVTIGIVALGAIAIGSWQPAVAQDAAAGEEEQQAMEELTIIHADVLISKFGGCPVELYVNDIPIARAGGEQQPFASAAIPEFLVDGENTLTLVICPGPTPSQAKSGGDCAWGAQAKPGMTAVARITRLQEGVWAEPGAGETLLELNWTGEKEDSLPKIITVKGDLGPQSGAWKWQSAETLTLDDATRKSAIAFIEKVKAAYEKADAASINKVATIKNGEMERAYPAYGENVFAPMLEEQMSEIVNHPSWKPGTLDPAEYDLRLVADGQMIEAIAKDWLSIVRMANDDFCLRMLISRIDGEWQIVR